MLGGGKCVSASWAGVTAPVLYAALIEEFAMIVRLLMALVLVLSLSVGSVLAAEQ
ncbi:MAG: hypothetical protein ACI9Y1_003607 [Lentisphaeria bacterium]